MKKFLTILLVALFAFSLAACKNDNVDTEDPTTPVDTDPLNNGQRIDFGDSLIQKTSIKVWIDDEEGEYMEAVIAEFNKLYPNIIVRHQHMGTVDARELLKTFGPSGNGADVFQFPHDHLAQAVLEDLVYALPNATRTALEGRAHELGLDIATLSYDETNKSFDPNSANAVQRLYAVPMSIESVGLYYNTDLVTTPHTTYEQMLAAAATWNAQVASDNATGDTRTNAQKGYYYLGNSSHWADSYFVQHIYSAFGFYPFGATLDNPNSVGFANAVPALTWMVNTLKPQVTGTGSHNSVTASVNFETGKIPYIITGPWSNEAFKNAGVNYSIAPMPTINVGGVDKATSTFAGAQMAAVYKYTDNASDAIRFVEFLNSDIAMKLQYDLKGKLPALTQDLLSNIDGVGDDVLMMAMAQQLETSIPMPTIPQVQYYWGPGESMLIQVWNNAVAPATAAATAEASYRTLAGLASGGN